MNGDGYRNKHLNNNFVGRINDKNELYELIEMRKIQVFMLQALRPTLSLGSKPAPWIYDVLQASRCAIHSDVIQRQVRDQIRKLLAYRMTMKCVAYPQKPTRQPISVRIETMQDKLPYSPTGRKNPTNSSMTQQRNIGTRR